MGAPLERLPLLLVGLIISPMRTAP